MICFITYARYLILCYMKAFYLRLHNEPHFVYFVFYSLVKAIYNEANERLKTLQASPPPLYQCSREHPSPPDFFLIFFLIFRHLLYCCDILFLYPRVYCKIILSFLCSLLMFT